MSLNALKLRFNEFLKTDAIDIIKDSINEVGIKKRSGHLLESIEYLGEIEPGVFRLVVNADYASYLNKGYAPFVMHNGGIHPGWEATWYSEIAETKIYEGIVKLMDENLNFVEE